MESFHEFLSIVDMEVKIVDGKITSSCPHVKTKTAEMGREEAADTVL